MISLLRICSLNIKFFFQQNLVLFWSFIVVLIVSVSILYIGTLKLETNLKSELLTISTEDMIAISNNIAMKIEEILNNQENIDKDMLEFVLDNSELKHSFENILTPIITTITPLKNKLKNQLAYRTFGCLKKLATF